ncbi:MAG TPA: bifunctional diguanylate cyclase/phosphodiesterase [Actinocrinis sp.]|uniref:putative bifunctional diguanylate cyclase/phosphodiesterase n=1 Tax=Actinocrinis sp. TaxID=1920516 RepID=UPI002DDCF1FF|nr:bifunctional diguanylate cyclase/phosphodiesterase [Actinocrinis sp.]HEV2347434.1 bifunctional diguanylate cyclase/phosphodiesterase [Actinocrinis sp.]
MAEAVNRTDAFARPLAFRAYLTAINVAGVCVIGYAAARLVHEIGVSRLQGSGAAWLLGFLVVIGELRPVLARHEHDGSSTAVAFSLGLISLSGWHAAVIAQAAAVIVSGVANRHAWWRTSFNVTQYSFSLALGGLAFGLFFRHPIAFGLALGWHRAFALVVAGIVYAVANHLFVWVALSLSRGVPVADLIRREGSHQFRATGAMVVLAPLVGSVALSDPWLLPLFVPVLLIVHGNAEAGREREWESNHDELTELPNRKLLRQHGEQALAEAARTGRLVGLLLLDLDRFKEVNDTLGHLTGDQLLRVVATRLVCAVGPEDTVARLGGDEFAVLLPNVADEAEAVEIAQRLADTFSDSFPMHGITLDLEVSVGVALYPEHAEEFEQLLQRADVAMYLAKKSRSVVARYEAGRDRNTPDRLALLGDLRRALEAGEVQLHYQPKVAFATGQVVGFEGLVRWQHATRGAVNPEEFVELAEQTGLMPKLTEYVVDQALAQTARWWRSGLAVPVAVNVSMRDIHWPGFVPAIQAGLLKYGVPPTALQLEITERVLLEDPQRAAATLGGLEALGVRLSLDDFGTGYSSLVLLRKIPVNEIKIDKSFVARLAHDPEDAAIVRSTVDLAHSLGLHVVAEGVEDDVTWDRLAALGCDAAQGWLLAKALPAHEATRWLNGRSAGPERESYLVR